MLADGFGEGAEFFLLLFAELGRHLHLDGHVEIALGTAGKGGHALIANPEGGASLGARPDLDGGLAIQGGNLELTTEGCGAEREGDFAEKRGALALEDIMVLDVDEGVKITRRAAAHACIAVAGGAEADAGINARRDAELDAGLALDAAFAPAVAAGIGNGLARAPAFRAGCLLDENARLSAHDPAARAGGAGFHAAA